jgi:hypothetical protein
VLAEAYSRTPLKIWIIKQNHVLYGGESKDGILEKWGDYAVEHCDGENMCSRHKRIELISKHVVLARVITGFVARENEDRARDQRARIPPAVFEMGCEQE